MWPLSRPDALVAITVEPSLVTCSWISCTSQTSFPNLKLNAFESFSVQDNTFHELVPFNIAQIQEQISVFLKTHRLHNARVAWALSGPVVTEQIVASPTSEFEYFPSPHHEEQLWHVRAQYLFPNESNQFVYYVARMYLPHVLAYQALSRTLGMRPARITTMSISLLRLARYIGGGSFRATSLRQRLIDKSYNIQSLYSPETIDRIMQIPRWWHMDTTPYSNQLLCACSLSISEADHYEKH